MLVSPIGCLRALEAHSTVLDRLNKGCGLERISRERVLLDDKTLEKVARYEAPLPPLADLSIRGSATFFFRGSNYSRN